jgi:hypothetical protein
MGKLLPTLLQVACIPLLLMLVGVFARRLGRRDGDNSPRRNDWAVGTTVLLMLLGTVVADFRTAADVSYLLMWLVGVLATAFLSLDHDRYKSWERDSQGLPTAVKRLWVGVVFQNVLCLIVFGTYQAWKVLI